MTSFLDKDNSKVLHFKNVSLKKLKHREYKTRNTSFWVMIYRQKRCYPPGRFKTTFTGHIYCFKLEMLDGVRNTPIMEVGVEVKKPLV